MHLARVAQTATSSVLRDVVAHRAVGQVEPAFVAIANAATRPCGHVVVNRAVDKIHFTIVGDAATSELGLRRVVGANLARNEPGTSVVAEPTGVECLIGGGVVAQLARAEQQITGV